MDSWCTICAFITPGSNQHMLEINPVLNTIKDLKGRAETLRGYL
jgi:hypothetical protein